MKHAITIQRRLDLSGAPWDISVNGLSGVLIDALPIERRHVDQAVDRFDKLMREDEAALTKAGMAS